MKRIVKILVFGALYCSGISTWYRLLTKHRLRILCYHRISPHPCDPLLDVSEERFRAQMQYLKQAYITLSLPLGLELLFEKRRRGVLPPVAVTFDDGTNDWLTRALPVLEACQVPATFFVCTGYIGNGAIPYPNRHAPAVALTHNELLTLAASPFADIGGHTVNHPHLSQLKREHALKEIEESRILLSSWIHKDISTFAYPFGDETDYTLETMELAREAGYRAGCILDERTCDAGDDPYALPRLVIFDEPLWMFKVRVSGVLDDFLSLFRERKRLSPGPYHKERHAPSTLRTIPTVSVVIRTRNHGALLKKALESVARQTFHDWEALILDEESTDDTPTLAHSCADRDSRFRSIRHSPPLGKTKNCNQGLHMARGEFIAMLDGDDYWSDPEKLARQVAAMRDHPHVTVHAGGVLKLDTTSQGRTHLVPNLWHTDHEIRHAIMVVNMIPHSAVMFRRADALMAGGYEARFPLSEDFDLFLKLGRWGAFAMDERVYCHYHLHECNATDLQRALQVLATLRIILRHAWHYPNALKGFFHNFIRLVSGMIPAPHRQRLARSMNYRQKLYHYMAALSRR